MSETVYQAGYAVPLKGFEYNKKSLDFLSECFGEDPSSVYEYQGEIEDFQFTGCDIYRVKNGLWLCFNKNTDRYSLDFLATIEEIDKEAAKLADKFGVAREDVRVYAHDWYTGGDNPFSVTQIP
jgi:hypothetical protein